MRIVRVTNIKEVDPVTDSLHDANCPFCPDNGKVDIIAQCKDAYLVQAVIEGEKAPHAFLIIPKQHITDILNLPATWQLSMKTMLRVLYHQSPLVFDHNLCWNIGEQAGQRLEHIHMWVIVRGGESDTTKLGLNGLIDHYNKLERRHDYLERHVNQLVD